MNWRNKYPTIPGYYWLRNYILSANPRMQPVSKLEVVNVVAEPDGFLLLYRIKDSRQWCVGDFISAEWYGPIEPPPESDKTVADRWVESFGPGEFSAIDDTLKGIPPDGVFIGGPHGNAPTHHIRVHSLPICGLCGDQIPLEGSFRPAFCKLCREAMVSSVGPDEETDADL